MLDVVVDADAHGVLDMRPQIDLELVTVHDADAGVVKMLREPAGRGQHFGSGVAFVGHE